MSLFGNVSQQRSPFGSNAPQQVNNERLEQAALEVDMVSDLFNRLVKSCHAKCIPEGYYREGSINKGEGVCLDRCVAKYFAVNEVVGKRMQVQQEQAAQQQQPAAAGKSGGGIGGFFGL